MYNYTAVLSPSLTGSDPTLLGSSPMPVARVALLRPWSTMRPKYAHVAPSMPDNCSTAASCWPDDDLMQHAVEEWGDARRAAARDLHTGDVEVVGDRRTNAREDIARCRTSLLPAIPTCCWMIGTSEQIGVCGLELLKKYVYVPITTRHIRDDTS